MHDINHGLLIRMWHAVWYDADRRGYSIPQIEDQMHERVADGLRSGAFHGVRYPFEDDFDIAVRFDQPLVPRYRRRPENGLRVRVNVVYEDDGRSDLEVEIDCRSLSAYTWRVRQAGYPGYPPRRERPSEFAEIRRREAETTAHFLHEGEVKKLFDPQLAAAAFKDPQPAAAVEKLLAIIRSIANAVAIQWALVASFGRPIWARSTYICHCPEHGIVRAAVCGPCVALAENRKLALEWLVTTMKWAGARLWDQLPDAQKHSMMLETDDRGVDESVSLPSDGAERFSLLEIDGVPEPVRPPPKPYVRPPTERLRGEVDPAKGVRELLLELY